MLTKLVLILSLVSLQLACGGMTSHHQPSSDSMQKQTGRGSNPGTRPLKWTMYIKHSFTSVETRGASYSTKEKCHQERLKMFKTGLYYSLRCLAD